MNAHQPRSPVSPSLRVALYSLTIFLSSAALMALEIAAARLLAPYIGASLYSWTAIIGVILGGLSLGNWLGGAWADRGGAESAVGWMLGAGALACVGALLLLTIIAPPLQNSELGLLTVSFLFVATLFFLPSVLLGVVTPLLITLALRLDSRTGHIVGMLHALAAFGSIVGTFATGYLFIQYFGTQAVVLGTATMLALLALVFLRRAGPTLAALGIVSAILVSLTQARGGFLAFCDRETNYFCIRVVDMSREVPFGEARGLVLDHLLHGISHRKEPRLLLAPYVQLMDELIEIQARSRADRPLRSFFAGGGAYTQPRALRASHPDAEIVVAELDPVVTEIARTQLYYDAKPDRVIHADARQVLAAMPRDYFDVIVGDIFHDISIPFHLLTLEYARLVHARLVTNGLYVLNVIDAHPDPRLVKSIVKTLNSVFPQVQVWLQDWPDHPERMTYVICAGGMNLPTKQFQAREGYFMREWIEVSEQLMTSGTVFATLPMLTDDKAPVEQLLSTLIFGVMGR